MYYLYVFVIITHFRIVLLFLLLHSFLPHLVLHQRNDFYTINIHNHFIIFIIIFLILFVHTYQQSTLGSTHSVCTLNHSYANNHIINSTTTSDSFLPHVNTLALIYQIKFIDHTHTVYTSHIYHFTEFFKVLPLQKLKKTQFSIFTYFNSFNLIPHELSI